MKKTDINILIDRSGSMASIASDIVQNINSFIQEQIALPGETVFSVYQFDDPASAYMHGEKFPAPMIEQVSGSANPSLKPHQYKPRSWTALTDAACILIDNVGKRLANTPQNERPDGVVVVIVTDGLDNKSEKYNKAQLKERIRHQEEKYNWKFLFLAANQDAVLSGAEIGIRKGDTTTYEATSAGVTKGLRCASLSVGAYRGTI